MADELDDGIDWTLLARYLSGEAAPAERREVEEWIDQDPARQEELTALRRLWEQARTLPAPGRIDAMWEALAREMKESDEVAPRRARNLLREREVRGIGLRHAVAAVAASLLLGVAGMGAWHRLATSGPGAADEVAARSYETARGHTARLRLADGTRVLLGPDSKLTVASLEAGLTRSLELVGEAVFEVEHDAKRPFIVRAGHAVTEDLGTEFGVKAFPGDSNVHVVVVEGRVALRADGAPAHSGTILEPGQLGRLDSVGRVEVQSGTDPGAYIGWADGRVVFEQTPLREVIVELERWYDVDLQIADSAIAAKRITLDVPAGALYDVLDAVAVPLNLRYEKTRDSIRLYR
jgi:transmembrane sensor